MKTGNWKPTVFLEETCGEKKGGNGCVLLLVWEMASPLDTLLFHIQNVRKYGKRSLIPLALHQKLMTHKGDEIDDP